jgi:UDP-N-acetylmuramate dehydrogenase
MRTEENVPLAKLTTLRVGGRARYVCTVSSVEEVADAVLFAREHELPFRVLGGGSNVLANDTGFSGIIIRMNIPGISYIEDGTDTLVRVGAGVVWDALVDSVALRGLWGLENLAGIPGTVGASPVQNIGAYGADVSAIFESALVFNSQSMNLSVYTKDDCLFGYRDSAFKHNRDLIICEVTFRLSRLGAPQLGYSDVAQLVRDGVDMSTPERIGAAVRDVRAKKFPDMRTHGTAGSFFKNPIVSREVFAKLSASYGAIPSFPAVNGIKIPLAFILDRALNLKGFRSGTVSLFGNQPLVIVADVGSTAHDVDAFARDVEKKVFDATGIVIEREVQSL